MEVKVRMIGNPLFFLCCMICLTLGILLMSCTPRDISIGYTLAAKDLTEIKGEHDEAIKKARQSVASDPFYAPGWYWLGVASYRKGLYDEAIKAFRRVIELKPQTVQFRSSYELMGWCFYYKTAYDQAQKYFDQSLTLKPDAAYSLAGRGKSYFQKGNYAEAEDDFNRAVTLNSTNWEHYYDRALARLFMGKYTESLHDFNKAEDLVGTEYTPGKVKCLSGKAFSYLGLGDSETAVNLLLKAKESTGYNPSTELAMVYYVTGDKEKAWKHRGGKGMLGVEVINYEKGTVKGAEVIKTIDGGSAQQAGILSGDVIVQLNKTDISNIEDLVKTTKEMKPGTIASTMILREGLKKKISFWVKSAELLMEDNKLIASLLAHRKGKSPASLSNEPSAEVSPYKATYKGAPEQMVNPSQSWAVIIGISEYKSAGKSGLENLIFADDDAKAFARQLLIMGWSESHIKLFLNEDATQRNIMIALESWLTKAGPNDLIVLFWAGHGFHDPEDPEKVYFACYDTDLSIPATGYRMDKVRDSLWEKKSRNVLVLADTCHAGKLITRGDRGLSIVPHIDKMKLDRTIPKGWIFMVGADTDRQAIEHTSWTNGAFTHSLLKGLAGGADGYESTGPRDGIVTMGELRSYLNSAMPEETQKILGTAKRPVITTSTGDPDIWNLSLQVQ